MKKTSLFMVTVMLSFGVMLTGCDNSDSGGGKTDAETPVFSVQPQGATYGDGVDADPMTVTASVTDGGTLTYQWYRSTTDNTTGGTTISGATKSAYTPSLAEIGTVYYYVVVINTNNSASGVKVKTASSDITVVTVMGGAESRATLRYQTVPLQTDDGNTYSLISSAKGRYGYMTGIEGRTEYNLWRYEYYIYLLGHIERVPIVYGDAFEYNGRTPITVSYEKSHCTEESVMESTTVSLERSVTNTATIGWGLEAHVGVEMGPVSASLTASFNSETSREEMESRSTSNTWETTQTKMSGTSSSISYTIGDNNEPPGKYRTTLFGTTDVYLYVKIRVDHTDGWRYVQTEIRRVEEAYTFACARPPNTLFWSIDYEPALDGDFGKTADTENLAIPNLDPAALPIPTIQIDG